MTPDRIAGVISETYQGVGPFFMPADYAQQLAAWCRDNMANYKVPRRIEFGDALPTNAAGKVQKFVLRGGPPAA